MNKLYAIILFFILFIFFSFNTVTLPIAFSSLLSRSQLVFVKPDSLVEVKCIFNYQMNYDYALKYPGKRFEIRYAILPMDSEIIRYEKRRKKGEKGIHPNKSSESVYKATLFNIGMEGASNLQLPGITYFDTNAVRNEFHASWGATALADLGPEFGQKYNYCVAMILHKDNIADAYVFYLFDDKKDMNLVKKYFYALKFQ